ncbi:glutathione S-transferase, partial [Lophiotrema nucula]
YAADKHGGETMYPKDLKQRADVNRWLLWEASIWFPCCYVYFVEYIVKPLLGAQPDEKVIEAESERFHNCAGILDERLSKSKWLCGENVTIVDFAVAAPMHLYKAQKLPLDKYPNLQRWMTEGMEHLDSWKKTKRCGREAASQQAGQPDVRTTVNYIKAVDGLIELYFYESEKTKDIHEPGDAPVEISVSDGWPYAKEFSIDKQGFSLHSFSTNHNDWEDEVAVQNAFYLEVVEFLKQELGAKRVLVFDHTIRTEKNAQKKLTDEENTSQRTPVML